MLARHELAFADHAAEFYLSDGTDVGRAYDLARLNLANRPTLRAFELAHKAAKAARQEDFLRDFSPRAGALGNDKSVRVFTAFQGDFISRHVPHPGSILMIRRRSVIAAICSFIATPSAMELFFALPAGETGRSALAGTAARNAAPVVFKIHGWDQSDSDRAQEAGQHVVVIHLTNSWRSAWL